MLSLIRHAALVELLVAYMSAGVKAGGCPKCTGGNFVNKGECNAGQCPPNKVCPTGSICGNMNICWVYQTGCCDFCEVTGQCAGIQANMNVDPYWHMGWGNFMPGPGEGCPKFFEASSQLKAQPNMTKPEIWPIISYMKQSMHPTLLGDGRLDHGKHEKLDLGRPGSCAATFSARILGSALSQNFALDTVGDCCDLCTQTAGCTAWNMEYRNCTLFDTVQEDVRWEIHYGYDPVFSGFNIVGVKSQEASSNVSLPSVV